MLKNKDPRAKNRKELIAKYRKQESINLDTPELNSTTSTLVIPKQNDLHQAISLRLHQYRPI